MVREVGLVPMSDRYIWSLEGSRDFSIASIRKVIDDKLLPNVSSKTRWVKYVPIKVNILAWKVKMDALPVRFNLSRRGIDIGSIVCPVCESGVEIVSHLFFKCSLLRQIARKVSSWWNVDYVDANSYEEWLDWLGSLRLPTKLKLMLEGVFYAVWTVYVVSTTTIALVFPYFNEILGVLGALNLWPLAIYFPVEMYIVQRKVETWSTTWVILKVFSFALMVVTVVALVGSIAGLIEAKMNQSSSSC
nr:RNA-directed DNA polymerase, eukaryota [Tanacetum cinerariifolium]